MRERERERECERKRQNGQVAFDFLEEGLLSEAVEDEPSACGERRRNRCHQVDASSRARPPPSVHVQPSAWKEKGVVSGGPEKQLLGHRQPRMLSVRANAVVRLIADEIAYLQSLNMSRESNGGLKSNRQTHWYFCLVVTLLGVVVYLQGHVVGEECSGTNHSK